MPTLIVEKRIVKKHATEGNHSCPTVTTVTTEHKLDCTPEDALSKTPKRKKPVTLKQRKVTPGTTNSLKRKLNEEDEKKDDRISKQRSLLSFFGQPPTKPCTQLRPKDRVTITQSTPPLKIVKSGIDMASLRDIVVGSAVSPLPTRGEHPNETPEDYERYKGSPLPTNLKHPAFPPFSLSSIPCERLLDRLNQQDISHSMPLPINLDGNGRSATGDSAIAVHDDDDGENTVCFSQESRDGLEIDLEQASSSQGTRVGGASSVKTIVNITQPKAKTRIQDYVQEVLVDMTQIDLTPSNDDEVRVADEAIDAIVPVKECIVDLTQIDSCDEQREPCTQDDNKSNLPRDQDSSIGLKLDRLESLCGSSDSATTASKITSHVLGNPSTIDNEQSPHGRHTSPDQLVVFERQKLRQKALKALAALKARVSNGVEGEHFHMPSHTSISPDNFDGELSQQAVLKLASIVQGSDLPLSAIASKVLEVLQAEGRSTSKDIIAEKIKTFFTRENYIACTAAEMKSIDKFEDVTNRMWRWEIISPDLFPKDVAVRVKKSQLVRKKIRNHSKACITLLRAIDDADKVMLDGVSKSDQRNKVLLKVKAAEDNLLRFERAFEKARLLEDLKAMQERDRVSKLHEREKEKQLKEKEVAARKQEEAKAKLANQKKREEEKEAKRLQIAEQRRKEEEEKIAAREKNKSRLLNFFVSKTLKEEPSEPVIKANVPTSSDPVKFWTLINSDQHFLPLFKNLSPNAIASRKRRTRMVSVSVYVTTTPDDPLSCQQPYAEQRIVDFPNKYRFLSFHEDHRPAYHGTWSKRSRIVNGRNPFTQDTAVLNYDDDSEAEWEEGDDEFGEDLQDEDADGEEENIDPIEGDTRNYNFQDGWMAEDDEVVYENEEVDDQTKRLRKMLKGGDTNLSEEIIAPFKGGYALDLIKRETKVDLASYVYVSEEKQTDHMTLFELEIMASEAEVLSDEGVYMDAFPPHLIDESFVGDPTACATSTAGPKPLTQEMSTEDMKIFAEFVHHAAFASKERLVEDLRQNHPTITSSRAQATRKLVSVALKRKNPRGGVIWEVNRKVLEELGLEKQLAMSIPQPEPRTVLESKTESALKTKLPTQKNKNREGETVNQSANVEPKKPNETSPEMKIESRKRKEPVISAASAALLARFIAGAKKPKSS